MRTAKILSIVVGAVIAVIALALLAERLFVDPNDYKPRIAAAVKNATGRELVLQGDIKLSVFPWIALELGPASLGNPPGFPEHPFVSFQHASVRVKMLPLLDECLRHDRFAIAGQDGDAVPRLFTAESRSITGFLDRGVREFRICSLELLKTHDIGPRRA